MQRLSQLKHYLFDTFPDVKEKQKQRKDAVNAHLEKQNPPSTNKKFIVRSGHGLCEKLKKYDLRFAEDKMNQFHHTQPSLSPSTSNPSLRERFLTSQLKRETNVFKKITNLNLQNSLLLKSKKTQEGKKALGLYPLIRDLDQQRHDALKIAMSNAYYLDTKKVSEAEIIKISNKIDLLLTKATALREKALSLAKEANLLITTHDSTDVTTDIDDSSIQYSFGSISLDKNPISVENSNIDMKLLPSYYLI